MHLDKFYAKLADMTLGRNDFGYVYILLIPYTLSRASQSVALGQLAQAFPCPNASFLSRYLISYHRNLLKSLDAMKAAIALQIASHLNLAQ